MEKFESLSHLHPQVSQKSVSGKLRKGIGRILRDLCQQKDVEVQEGHAMPDNIHMCLKIPPKYSVSYIIGFLKGKSAVRIQRELLQERRMSGLHF